MFGCHERKKFHDNKTLGSIDMPRYDIAPLKKQNSKDSRLLPNKAQTPHQVHKVAHDNAMRTNAGAPIRNHGHPERSPISTLAFEACHRPLCMQDLYITICHDFTWSKVAILFWNITHSEFFPSLNEKTTSIRSHYNAGKTTIISIF